MRMIVSLFPSETATRKSLRREDNILGIVRIVRKYVFYYTGKKTLSAMQIFSMVSKLEISDFEFNVANRITLELFRFFFYKKKENHMPPVYILDD